MGETLFFTSLGMKARLVSEETPGFSINPHVVTVPFQIQIYRIQVVPMLRLNQLLLPTRKSLICNASLLQKKL